MKAGKPAKRTRASHSGKPVEDAVTESPHADATGIETPQELPAVNPAGFVLVSDCTARNAEALRSGLLGLVGVPGEVSVDIGAVERVDTVCLQLLGAFVRERRRDGKVIRWQGQSEPLVQAALLLGLGETLAVGTAA